MSLEVEVYNDMIGQKITGIAVNRKGNVKFFLEDGISFEVDEMEWEEKEV